MRCTIKIARCMRRNVASTCKRAGARSKRLSPARPSSSGYNRRATMKVSVILPAAGLGTRMGREKAGTSRKQFMLLEGAPILIHTIRKFLRSPSVTEIVVALRPEDLDWARGLVHHEHPTRPVRFVEGGGSRQESVQNAL